MVLSFPLFLFFFWCALNVNFHVHIHALYHLYIVSTHTCNAMNIFCACPICVIKFISCVRGLSQPRNLLKNETVFWIYGIIITFVQLNSACAHKHVSLRDIQAALYTKYMYMSVLCCFALFVCLTLLASFFLPSYLSFKNMYLVTDGFTRSLGFEEKQQQRARGHVLSNEHQLWVHVYSM